MAALPAGQDRPARASLSAHEDIELIGMVQSLPRDSSLREAACEELVCRYDFLVHHAAMRYRNSPEPMEELCQAGYVGLIKAINYFDATLGPDLKAYALPSSAASSNGISVTNAGRFTSGGRPKNFGPTWSRPGRS